jgi:hypothetical protein
MPVRNRLPLSLLTAAFAVLLATAAAPAAAVLLVVEVRTNYFPGFDFTVVRTEVTRDGVVVGRAEVPAFIGDGETLRVAELELPADPDYRVEVELVHRTRRPVARRTVLVDLRGTMAVTVLAVKPTGVAEKAVRLIADNDGDGLVSPGDLLRYTVVVDGDVARFSDDPDRGLRLVNGSVTTSFGTVTRGNSGPDHLVVVDGLAGAPAPVVITFDCEVAPPSTANQGQLELRDDSETSSLFARISIPTDDPRTSPVGDPTLTAVACSAGTCAEDLATCERDLDGCRAERQELRDQLAALLADPDRDGVPAVLDLCLKTFSGAAVDERGCSQAQFCGRVDTTKARGDALCRAADWNGDEPLAAPRDCRPGTKGLCVPE